MFRRSSMLSVAALALLGSLSMVHAQTAGSTTPGAAAAKPAAVAMQKQSMSTPAKAHAKEAKKAEAPKVDLNSASREELIKLPGIGEAIADRIIAARPFNSKQALVTKKLLTQKQYQGVAHLVFAKQEPLTASKTSK